MRPIVPIRLIRKAFASTSSKNIKSIPIQTSNLPMLNSILVQMQKDIAELQDRCNVQQERIRKLEDKIKYNIKY